MGDMNNIDTSPALKITSLLFKYIYIKWRKVSNVFSKPEIIFPVIRTHTFHVTDGRINLNS